MFGKYSQQTWTSAIRYGICAMCCSMLHSLFTSFYVDYFLRRQLVQQTISEASGNAAAASNASADPMTVFALGQMAYAIWNGLNDFVFGWIGDRFFPDVHRRRYHRILIGGPLWAIVFALLWNPGGVTLFPVWVHPSVQFSLMMIMYDGFFSFTTVSFRALLTDISTSPRDRELCNAVAAVFHVVGSCGVWFASYTYENGGDGSHQGTGGASDASLISFRWFMSTWAVAAGFGFVVASINGREVTLKTTQSAHVKSSTDSTAQAMATFAKDALKCQSMLVAVLVWAVQEYSCTFATNFFAMFLAFVCGDDLSVGQRSSLLLLSFVVPHVITLVVTPLIPKLGKKSLISWLFASRALVGVGTILLARSVASGVTQPHHRILFAAFLFLNRILTEAVCRLQALILSDIVDEDTIKFHRPQSLAASVNGLMSLVSKPFQSVAPVLTCYYLASHGILLPASSAPNTEHGTFSAVLPHTASVVTSLLGQTALITSGVMWIVWQKFYNLDGHYLISIQRSIKHRSEESHAERSNTTASRKREADEIV
jgi:Na+/melibiose symporter-like transporter